jgi:peptide/nickel transport system permease protein
LSNKAGYTVNTNSIHFTPRRLGLIITFGLAALAMIYLSYSLPRLLPGDFVTAMYASSPVTLTAEQEAELRAFYTEDPGF